MGMFSDLLGKILGHASASAASAPAQPAASPAPSPVGGSVSGGVTPTPTPESAGGSPSAPAPGQPAPATPDSPTAGAPPTVDVSAVLDDLASKNSEGLDWKKSIVDLLKLVGMDSSLSARKELAKELGYTGDESDSATMNVWLHKAVLKKLSENGGKVPADLLK